MTNKARQAQFCGGTPPLGYNVVNGHYEINEAEAPAIRLMFKMYADGYSYLDIVNKLDELGFRSKRGTKITKNALYYLLINERYTGTYTWNKYQYKELRKRIKRRDNENYVRLEGAIPPIIDIDTWERVKKRMSSRENRAINKAKREYLLSGLIECGYCGSIYTGFASTNKSSGEETIYYMCGKKNREGAKVCCAKNVRADDIEPFAFYSLQKEVLDKSTIEATADRIIENTPGSSKTEKMSLIKQTDALQQKINKLIDDLTQLDRNTTAYKTILSRIEAQEEERISLQKQLDAIPEAADIDRDKLIKKLKEDAKQLEERDFFARRAIIRKHIKKIVITNDAVELQLVDNYDTTGGTTQI